MRFETEARRDSCFYGRAPYKFFNVCIYVCVYVKLHFGLLINRIVQPVNVIIAGVDKQVIVLK